jgi:hypothetical protein
VGYELQIVRGESVEDVRGLEPLDEEDARELLLRAARAYDLGAEIVVPRESLTATVAFTNDADGRLLSLWISVDVQDGTTTHMRRDFSEILRLLLDTAHRLGARVYDRQQQRFLTADDVGPLAEHFAQLGL